MTEDNKILVVDDDKRNTRLLASMLQAAGYNVITALNGEQALEMAASDKSVKLVLLDVMMPGIDGYEVCRRLRTSRDTRHMAIIMITALDSPREKTRGIESGADDILTKPVYASELLARVKNIMEARISRQNLEKAYSSIHNILVHSERLLGNLDAMWFDFSWASRELTRMVFSGLGNESRPEAVYVINTSDCEKSFLYYFDDTSEQPHETVANLTINQATLACCRRNHFCICNYEDEDLNHKNCKDCLPQEVSAQVGRPVSNHVIYFADGLLVMAVNFSRRAGTLQGQILKGFALQLLLYRTIFQQAGKVREAFSYTAGALARAAEAVDAETGNHIMRVGEYSRTLASGLGLSNREVQEIAVSSQMHDVGKMKINPRILLKPGPLTKEEFMEMENHTIYGVLILGDSPYLETARIIALSHHEKWDGSGYPYGTGGEKIPLPARIVAVADVYDALRGKRPYKLPFTHEEACRIILEGDGRVKPEHFCPDVLQTFKRMSGKFAEIFDRWQ